MNHEQNIACANGGFVTEDAVRGAMSRRWRTRARSAGAARPARSGAVGPGAADPGHAAGEPFGRPSPLVSRGTDRQRCRAAAGRRDGPLSAEPAEVRVAAE